jgi:hypothetical protein
MENELLDEASFQTWEEWQAEEWRRTCALTYADIMRICGLGASLATADLVGGELP